MGSTLKITRIPGNESKEDITTAKNIYIYISYIFIYIETGLVLDQVVVQNTLEKRNGYELKPTAHRPCQGFQRHLDE